MTSAALIDVHTHVTPRTLPDDPGLGPAWPCMVCDGLKRATMMVGGKPFRELDDRSWDVGRRCADMDADGVSMQVLSPMPELLSYWLPEDHAEYMADCVNATIADMVTREPKRFMGLGMVPLQNPARATKYLETIKSRFGLVGVEIGSNINGDLPGDAKFEAFYDAAAHLNLAIFIHALHPIATKTVTAGPEFAPLVGFPLDVAMAGASLILNGTMERYPSLRVGLSHGGGAMMTLVPRMEQGWQNLPILRNRLPLSPRAYVHRFYYDSNVYDAGLLHYIATRMAPGRVFAGTDYPYAIMQTDPAGYIAGAELAADVHRSVTHAAACDFLGLTPVR